MCTCVNAIENAREAALAVAILAHQRSAASRSAATPVAKVTRDERAGRQPHPVAQRRDRIEHRAGRPGQRPAVERQPVGRRSSAADEARAIGLPFDRAAEPALDARGRGTPRRPVRRPLRGRRLNSRPALCAIELGFDEQLAERRMREVVFGARQHDFGVAGDFDLARRDCRG